MVRAAAAGPGPTICHILHSLGTGGAEVLAARIARRFAGAHRVVFACLEDVGPLGDQLRAEGFGILNLGKGPGMDWGAPRRLRAFFQAEGVDLVHAHHGGPFLYAAMARFPGRRPALLLTEHGLSYSPGARSWRHILVHRFLFCGNDRIAAVSGAIRQSMIDDGRFPADRIEVVLNGIDLSPHQADGPDRAAVRRELGLDADDFVLIQVARLAPIKDHETALRALGAVLPRRPDARLVLVGGGPETDSIRAYARDRGLAAHVLMLGERRDVPRLLHGADVAILTSRSEGLPLSLVEAMAAGLPIVATAVDGVPEVVVDGETGLTAAAGDAAALADAILALADDPARRRRMGRAGRRRAEDVFSEDRMVADYGRIYHEMR